MFKLFPCCVSEQKNTSGDAYKPCPENPTNPDTGPTEQPTPDTPRDHKKEDTETSKVESTKVVKIEGLNLTAQKLLLGDLADDLVRNTRNVRLNVYGVPNCPEFSSVFYSTVLPKIESKCSEFNYEVELLDLASSFDSTAAVFYDENFDFKDLVSCQGYKRGPYRSFNLIVIPSSSIDKQYLAPVFDENDFSAFTSSIASEETKKLISDNFVKTGNHKFFRLKKSLSFDIRSKVISTVYEVLQNEASLNLKDKYSSTPFEQIVNYLFANANDVRETTCVLYLNDSSVDATVAATSESSTRVKTLANTIRAQLPSTSFVEVSESDFKTTHGDQISSVLCKMFQSFCSEFERLSYIADSMPHSLHNELLTHNGHLKELSRHTTKADIFDKFRVSVLTDFVTCVVCEDPFQRQMMFAKKLIELNAADDGSETLRCFRFCNSSFATFSTNSLLHSVREQICYMTGTHPSEACTNDLMKLLKNLLEVTDQSVVIAFDDIEDVDWVPAHDAFDGRVHFFLTSSKVETFEGKIKNGTVGTFGTNANLEIMVLKDRFKNLVLDSGSTSSSDEAFLDSIVKLFTDHFHKSCSLALHHVSKSPLMFSQSDMRTALSFEDQVGHSMAIETLYILLSPLLFKVYSSSAQYYCMLKANKVALKFLESNPPTILESLKTDSQAKKVEHCLALKKSKVESTKSDFLSTKTFPNVTGLKLVDVQETSSDPLSDFGKLLEELTPQLYLEFLKCVDKGTSESDFSLLCEAIQSNQYSLSLAANVTYKAAFFQFFDKKKSENVLKQNSHPFCWKLLDQLSKCESIPKESPKSEADSSVAMRPNKIKLITWLNAEGSKDFILLLLENQTPSENPKGRLEVIRLSDMKIVRRIDMTKIPVEVKNINLTSCVVNTERTLKWIDLNEGVQKVQLKSQLNIDYPCYGIQSSDLVVAMSRNKMYVNGVQLSTNTTVFNFKVGEDRFLNSLLVAPDGSYCACGDTVQKPMPLLIWDLKQQILIHDIRMNDHEFDMQLAMVSNHYIAVVVKHIDPDSLNFVNVYEFSSQYNKYKFHEDASVTSLFLTPDDHNLMLGLADCSVVIHHLGSSDEPFYLTGMHKTPVDVMRCNLDASVLLTCSMMHPFSDRTINLFSVAKGDLVGSLTPQTHFTCVEIAPAGKSFLYGTKESSALIKVTFEQKEKSEAEAVFGTSDNDCKHTNI